MEKRTIDKVIVQMSNDEVSRDTRYRVLVVIEPVAARIVGASQIDPGSDTKLQNSAHEASRGRAMVPSGPILNVPRSCSCSRGMNAAAIVGGGLGHSPGPRLLQPIHQAGSGLDLDRIEVFVAINHGGFHPQERFRAVVSCSPENTVGNVINPGIVEAGAPDTKGTVAGGNVDQAWADAMVGGVGHAVCKEGTDGELAQIIHAVSKLAGTPKAAVSRAHVVGAQFRLVLVTVGLLVGRRYS